jgi:hypothetical protein
MNAKVRNTYDREVSHLRRAGIITQIRSNGQAKTLAAMLRKDKQNNPRFKVVLPGKP